MRIGEIRTLAGPNVYSFHPVLSMKLYLDDLTGRESHEIPCFNEILLEALPGLAKHHCCMERDGGFLERLCEGTYFGHIVEHVALELTDLAGVPVFHGKTRRDAEPGVYNIVIEYEAEQGTKRLLNLAVEMVEWLILQAQGGAKAQSRVKDLCNASGKGRAGNCEPFSLEKRLAEVRKIIARTELGPTTKAITKAATSRNIPW